MLEMLDSGIALRLPSLGVSTTNSSSDRQNVVYPAESQVKGQGDENSHAVRSAVVNYKSLLTIGSGLDNAGKTTIVKKIMGEDVNTVSPTLGFNIKTIDYEGEVQCLTMTITMLTLPHRYKLNICNKDFHYMLCPPLTGLFQGMSVARRHSARTGGIILRRPMR